MWIEVSDGVNWKQIKWCGRKYKTKKPYTILEPEARFLRRTFKEARTFLKDNANVRVTDLVDYGQEIATRIRYQNGKTYGCGHVSERYERRREYPLWVGLIPFLMFMSIGILVAWLKS